MRVFPVQTTAPTRSPPLVTWVLIAANCAIFLFQIGLGPEELEHFLYQFALIPARYFAPLPFKDFVGDPLDYLPFVSNMFLHGGWLHLILNMWTLCRSTCPAWACGRDERLSLGCSHVRCARLWDFVPRGIRKPTPAAKARVACTRSS
jgi:hypothetical protein